MNSKTCRRFPDSRNWAPASLLKYFLGYSFLRNVLGLQTKNISEEEKSRKYFRGEAEGLLYGTSYRPVDAFFFPPPAASGEDPGRPSAMDFMVSGKFNTTNDGGSTASRKAADSSDPTVIAAENTKTKMYRKKVREAWKPPSPPSLFRSY